MNPMQLKLTLLAVSLAFGANALAQSVSKSDYKADKNRASVDFKSAKAACAHLSGNANDVCLAEAKGRESVILAEIEDAYQPTRKTHYELRLAKAEAAYEVARIRCNDRAGNAKDVCVAEAKAAETIAKAEAKAQLKTDEANDTARDKSAAARNEADSKASDARRDATVDTLEARYSVARERCDSYAGGSKDYCISQAKARFGKL